MIKLLKAFLLLLILSLSVSKLYLHYELKAAELRFCAGASAYYHLAAHEFIYDVKQSIRALKKERPGCINKSDAFLGAKAI